MAARLVMSVGGETRDYALGPQPVSIGRGEENAIQISDTKSSRKHCTVLPEGEGWAVQDHGSSNGTRVNGKPVTKTPLKEGDVITIGSTSFTFRGEAAAGVPAAAAPGAAPAAAPGGEEGPTLEEPAEAPAAPEKWVLTMDLPEGGTKTVDLGDKVTIGRNPKNTIPTQDAKASNFHCEIVRDGPGYAIRDLNSTNGTRVDGNLVETLSLYHGSVIEVGKTRFIIKNLAVPDTGPGFDSGPVGGAEFATFQRRRGRFPVAPLVILAVAVAGLFGLNELAKRSVRKAEFRNVEGNLLAENYSFEGTADAQGFPSGFRSLQGDDDRVEVAGGAAKTGKKALCIRKAPGPDPAAAVEVAYAEEIAISSSKTYELSAFVQPEGLQGIAGVKIVWRNLKDPAFRRESYGTLVSGDGAGFAPVKVRAAPPFGATQAEAVCFVKGREGTARFDDLELREAAEEPVSVLSGNRFEVRVGPQGLFAIRREGGAKDIVRDGQMVLFTEPGGKVWQRFCRLAEGYPKKSQDAVEIQGEMYEFQSGKWIGFTETVKLAGGQIAIACAAGGEGKPFLLGGLVFTPDPEWIARGVGIVAESGYALRTDVFEAEGVQRMLWSLSERPVSFNYDPPVTCMGVREDEALLLLQLLRAGEDGGVKVSVTLQTDFKELELAISAGFSAAKDALKAGRPGEAVRQYRTIVEFYPFHRKAGEAREEMNRLEAEAQGEACKVQSRFDLAQFFHNLLELEASLGDAGNFLEKYAGSEREETVKNLAGRIRLAIQDQRVRQGQGEAEGFLLRAREHRARKELALARLLYRHVAAAWPGTEWAKTAEAESQALDGPKKEGEGK